jgi:hypothetical protein
VADRAVSAGLVGAHRPRRRVDQTTLLPRHLRQTAVHNLAIG